MKQVITDEAPKAIGPYSQAIRIGELLFCSGQTPLEPTTMLIEVEGIEKQTKRVIDNIRIILDSQGLTLASVVKTTVYLTDMELFQPMNVIYAEQFGTHEPARTTIAVKGLPLNALVEIECIASFSKKQSVL